MEGERGSGDGGTQARMISVQRGHLQTSTDTGYS